MAIRQERMIALINAAIAYRDLCELITNKWLARRDVYQMTHAEILAQWAATADQSAAALQELKNIHDLSLTVEQITFHRNARRNARERVKMQVKRREAGIPMRTQVSHFGETDRLNTRSADVQRNSPKPNPPEYRTMTPAGMYNFSEETRQDIEQAAERAAVFTDAVPQLSRETLDYIETHPELTPEQINMIVEEELGAAASNKPPIEFNFDPEQIADKEDEEC